MLANLEPELDTYVVVHPYLYPLSLALISALVMALERAFPERPGQRRQRPKLVSDLVHLVFNGHFLGVMLAGLGAAWVLTPLESRLREGPLWGVLHHGLAREWPMAVQMVVAPVLLDFAQWCIHRLLHRVPMLWELHKTHHSVVDGEMDFVVAFRFSWLEVVVYKGLLYAPLVFLGFAVPALMVHAVFGTLVGHLNHANVRVDYGPLRYLLNSPRMHLWHHAYDADAKSTVNFGIIFSCWDWLFGTARLPDHPPPRIGFAGVEEFPDTFLAQEIWPLQRVVTPLQKHPRAASLVGALVLGAAWYLGTGW